MVVICVKSVKESVKNRRDELSGHLSDWVGAERYRFYLLRYRSSKRHEG